MPRSSCGFRGPGLSNWSCCRSVWGLGPLVDGSNCYWLKKKLLSKKNISTQRTEYDL